MDEKLPEKLTEGGKKFLFLNQMHHLIVVFGPKSVLSYITKKFVVPETFF